MQKRPWPGPGVGRVLRDRFPENSPTFFLFPLGHRRDLTGAGSFFFYEFLVSGAQMHDVSVVEPSAVPDANSRPQNAAGPAKKQARVGTVALWRF